MKKKLILIADVLIKNYEMFLNLFYWVFRILNLRIGWNHKDYLIQTHLDLFKIPIFFF